MGGENPPLRCCWIIYSKTINARYGYESDLFVASATSEAAIKFGAQVSNQFFRIGDWIMGIGVARIEIACLAAGQYPLPHVETHG
jgi:hypothetical protein